ncbi:signal recognition particle binding [Raphanus sativus]|nr:signal recognition particle binding [Raphanus sativus]
MIPLSLVISPDDLSSKSICLVQVEIKGSCFVTSSVSFLDILEMENLEDLKIMVEEWSNQGIEYLQKIPPTHLYATVGVLLFTTILLLLSIRLARRTKFNTVLLSGLSGSGKTVLFYQLLDGSSHQGTKGKIKHVHLVDVPGHSRLRPKLEEFLPQAAAIVFVVDALEFIHNCRAASEYLYDILTNANVVKKKIPVLLCCNKTDKLTAHTKEFIRKQMEKEIEKLRASRSAVSTADIANDFTIGIEGEVFSFSHCSNKVTVAEASGLNGETFQVQDFIREHIKP